MSRHDNEDMDISNFVPTKRQILAKIKLHTFVPSHVIGALTPDNIVRVQSHLFPVRIDEIMEWNTKDSMFWFWFILQNEQAVRMNNMKSQAVDTISNILAGNVPDAKLASTQLKAAQLLLNISDKVSPSVTKNTMNISGSPRLPKALAKKSERELQAEIKRLQLDMDESEY